MKMRSSGTPYWRRRRMTRPQGAKYWMRLRAAIDATQTRFRSASVMTLNTGA